MRGSAARRKNLAHNVHSAMGTVGSDAKLSRATIVRRVEGKEDSTRTAACGRPRVNVIE